MNVQLEDFIAGFQESLQTKYANVIFDTTAGASIIPSIEKQQTWNYARDNNKLLLHDGNIVHQFEMLGEENQHEDFPLKKIIDLPIPAFEALTVKGKAQVHRANPGVVYVTLHDGTKNPTYTIKHETDDQWRAIPKLKKTAQEIDFHRLTVKLAEDFLTGALDKTIKGIDFLGRKTINGLMLPGLDPLKAAGYGLAAGASYDLGKRLFYNTPEENENETSTDRALRYIAPAALLGGMGALSHGAFTNYYNNYPMYKA